MDNIRIYSERKYQTWPSYFVVFEWEDIFVKNGIKLCYYNNDIIRRLVRKILNTLGINYDYRFKWNGKCCNLAFILYAERYELFTNKMNIIPIFLDFPEYMVPRIMNATKDLPVFVVTCYDIYCLLKQNGCNNVIYQALSISDIYFGKTVPQKSIDVIQLGRKNSVLHSYMLDYCKDHPDVEYVYQLPGSLVYKSTIRGTLDEVYSRGDYLNLLASCKVSLVSSPSMDNSRNFGNIDFLTPRFYESAINYCYMLGRYSCDKEANFTGLDKICPNVENYSDFEKILENYLNTNSFIFKDDYDRFINNNVTSARVLQLIKVLEEN